MCSSSLKLLFVSSISLILPMRCSSKTLAFSFFLLKIVISSSLTNSRYPSISFNFYLIKMFFFLSLFISFRSQMNSPSKSNSSMLSISSRYPFSSSHVSSLEIMARNRTSWESLSSTSYELLLSHAYFSFVYGALFL